MALRRDGREPDDLRPITFTRDFTEFAAGSVLVEFGRTRVLCTASAEDRVPPWLRGKGRGWVTAEYSMLPGSTSERNDREAARGKQSGRTQEIQRLIGRSLRAVTDLEVMGEAQITVDCDVLQADGGTRTASICGGYLALHDACSRLVQAKSMPAHPITDTCAAISVGIVDTLGHLDLDYSEDVRAEVDMNVVMTGAGRFVEVQGTAEGQPFSRAELDDLIGLAESGILSIFELQRELLAVPPEPAAPLTVRFVLATASEHKAREIDAILRAAGADVELVPRPDDVPDVEETGVTFEDNARLKAVALCEATGLPAMADDTGLEVDALGGAPGVHSGRFAGDHDTDRNIAKLLELLGGVPEGERTARFVTVAIARFADGREVAAFGESAGSIVMEDREGPAGFGYDRVFVPDEGDGRTFAEMSAAEKHEISHRGRAFRTLADGLRIMDATS